MIRVITGDFTGPEPNPVYPFPYESDHFQKHAFSCIERGEHVLVTAHTGSGKTDIGIYAIAHHLRQNNKIVYTSPIKALSNQKYEEMVRKFEVNFSSILGKNIEVGILTGDYKIKPTADIVIMTTEILKNALMAIKSREGSFFDNDFLNRLKCVIFDEVHYINNKERGHVWEQTINLLGTHIQLVMLSATIEKPERLAQLVANKSTNIIINLIPTSHRVVPLTHYILCCDEMYPIMTGETKFSDTQFDLCYQDYKISLTKNKQTAPEYRLNELVRFLDKKKLLQAILFCFSKNNCQKFAEMLTCNLVSNEEAHEISKLFEHYTNQVFSKDKDLKTNVSFMQEFYTMEKLLVRGIAYHHSGVAQSFREIVEIIFARGLIKVLFATETFAVGVNMPTRTVVFTELEKWDDHGRRFLETAEYRQMAGRAGRRGIDKIGNVIIFALYDFPTKYELKTMMLGSMPAIKSHFELSYSWILQIVQSKTKTVEQFISQSLYQLDNFDKEQSYNIEISILEKELIKFKPNISQDQEKKLSKLLKLDQEEQELREVGISLNKQQRKDRDGKRRELEKDTNLKKLYEIYHEYNSKLEFLETKKRDRDLIRDYIKLESHKRLNLLLDNNYLKDGTSLNIFEISEKDLTPKGIVVSLINECNGILLTELLTNKILDNLKAPEIVALLSVFIEEIRLEDTKSIDKIACSSLRNRLYKIVKIAENFINQEESLDIIPHKSEGWFLCYDYIDLVYLWATGASASEVIQEASKFGITLKIGNFVPIIKDLNNIVDNLISLCPICGCLEYVPELEAIKPLIIRDITNITSLYF